MLTLWSGVLPDGHQFRSRPALTAEVPRLAMASRARRQTALVEASRFRSILIPTDMYHSGKYSGPTGEYHSRFAQNRGRATRADRDYWGDGLNPFGPPDESIRVP